MDVKDVDAVQIVNELEVRPFRVGQLLDIGLPPSAQHVSCQ